MNVRTWEEIKWKSVERSVDVRVEFQWDPENHRWMLLSLPEHRTMFQFEVESEGDEEG
jgi:hypothetical protein